MTNLVEKFRSLIAINKDFQAMFSSVKAEKYGVSYIFNAIVGCAVVLKDGRYYDIQDISVHEYEGDLPEGARFGFSSLEELVDAMIDQFEEEMC